MKNKIGWCNATWNPVWGCLNNCEYCYARKMAKRFAHIIADKDTYKTYGGSIDNNSLVRIYEEKKEDLVKFRPTFLYSQFEKSFPKSPQKIFVGSMSEIRFWEREWLLKIFKKIEEYPQHAFQFLTKYPYIYHRLEFPVKSWLGFTVTTNKDLANGVPHIEKLRTYSLTGKYLYFVSIEPILEEINPLGILFVYWVILGAETGDRKGRIIPKKEWIENIIDYCRRNKIPVYLKDSLKNIYLEEIKEFPKNVTINKL